VSAGAAIEFDVRYQDLDMVSRRPSRHFKPERGNGENGGNEMNVRRKAYVGIELTTTRGNNLQLADLLIRPSNSLDSSRVYKPRLHGG